MTDGEETLKALQYFFSEYQLEDIHFELRREKTPDFVLGRKYGWAADVTGAFYPVKVQIPYFLTAPPKEILEDLLERSELDYKGHLRTDTKIRRMPDPKNPDAPCHRVMTLKVDADLLLQMMLIRLKLRSKFPFPVLTARVEIRWNREEACDFLKQNGYREFVEKLEDEIRKAEEEESEEGSEMA